MELLEEQRYRRALERFADLEAGRVVGPPRASRRAGPGLAAVAVVLTMLAVVCLAAAVRGGDDGHQPASAADVPSTTATTSDAVEDHEQTLAIRADEILRQDPHWGGSWFDGRVLHVVANGELSESRVDRARATLGSDSRLVLHDGDFSHETLQSTQAKLESRHDAIVASGIVMGQSWIDPRSNRVHVKALDPEAMRAFLRSAGQGLEFVVVDHMAADEGPARPLGGTWDGTPWPAS